MSARASGSGELARTQPRITPQAPATEKLPSGTALYRVHRFPHKVSEFNSTSATPYAGGRFDSPDGTYAHLYAGQSEAAAIAETLLRSLPSNEKGRFLPKARLKDRVLSELRTTRDLELVRAAWRRLSSNRSSPRPDEVRGPRLSVHQTVGTGDPLLGPHRLRLRMAIAAQRRSALVRLLQ
jgi:hypothetical protein